MLVGPKTACLAAGSAKMEPGNSTSWKKLDPSYAAGLPKTPVTDHHLQNLYLPPVRIWVRHGKVAFDGLESLKGPQVNLTVDIHRLKARQSTPQLLLDFGREVTGCIELGGWGGTVIVGTGESIGEAMFAPSYTVQRQHRGPDPQTLMLKKGAIEKTRPSGFRYVALTFLGTAATPLHMTQLRLDFQYYPVRYRGAFGCSDPLLTRIWYTGAYTAHLCMQQQIWDGPKRDRQMWMGDLQVSGRVIDDVFLCHHLMQLTMRQLRLQAQGHRPAADLPANDINGIPGYSCAWICGLYDYYQHTKAAVYLRSQHQLLLSMLLYMKQAFNKNNLFANGHRHWCFADWAPHLNKNGPTTYLVADLFTCLAVRRAVSLLRDLGDRRHAATYARWDAQLVAAARRRLANPRTHTYGRIVQVNAMAVYSGVADHAQRRAIRALILGPTHCPSPGPALQTPYYAYFVIAAMGRLGLTEEALRFVRHEWGGMIHRGATTFWEEYNPLWWHGRGYWSYQESLCHGWSAGVTAWLSNYVLGVRPRSAGFASTVIAPHLGDLQWVRGRVPTPQGDIQVYVKKSGRHERITVTLPAKVRAVVVMPGKLLRVDGRRPDVNVASPDRIELSSGRHVIVAATLSPLPAKAP